MAVKTPPSSDKRRIARRFNAARKIRGIEAGERHHHERLRVRVMRVPAAVSSERVTRPICFSSQSPPQLSAHYPTR
jgi:hypothetical protein